MYEAADALPRLQTHQNKNATEFERKKMLEFKDKVVLVSAGAAGIGKGIALEFARQGAGVFCIDVDRDAGSDLVSEAESLPGPVIFHHADMSEMDALHGMVETAVRELGSIDILINNLGIEPPGSHVPAHELDVAVWDLVIDVNLKSAFLMSKYCIPDMLRRGGGVIINISSVQALQSMKCVPAYAASKGGMLSLTRQLAMEYAEDNIRVLTVNPGTTVTPLLEKHLNGLGGDMEARRQSIARAYPMRRFGRIEEIANVVVFLASEKASFMTGEYVNVDGGAMAKGAWG